MPARSAELVPSSPKRRKAIDFKAQQQAQHTATISLIVKNTGKIQKEIGFRRARLKVRFSSSLFQTFPTFSSTLFSWHIFYLTYYYEI